MITRSYKSKLKSVLRLYRDFKSTFEKIGQPVSSAVTSLYGKLHNPFSIAVISDRLGGSESFINACLGKGILPEYDCISAAIRIRSGKSYSYEAETTSGRHLEGNGWKNVHEFLVQRVIVPGRYRYLPAACINHMLIKKKGAVTDDDIAKTENALFRDSGSKESARLKFLVGQYIKRFRSEWENIVTEITVTVPLSEEFRGIAITDCPIIPAECNEWNTTRKPADDAGAIVFVRPLDGKAQEIELINDLPALPNRDNVFLIFTGRADLPDVEFEDLRHKALETWNKAIPQERIFFADCRAQRFLDSLEECSAERIEDCMDEWSSVWGKIEAAEKIWLRSHGDADLFREKMEELAGFNEIHRAVGKFVRNARNRQLAEFLGCMIQDCSRIRKTFLELADLKEKETEALKSCAFNIIQKADEREHAETAVKIPDTYNLINSYFGKWRSGGIILQQLHELTCHYISSLYNGSPIGKFESIKFAMIHDRQICNFNLIPGTNGMYDIESINYAFPGEAAPGDLPDFEEPHSEKLKYMRETTDYQFTFQPNAIPRIIDTYEIYEPFPIHGYSSIQFTYQMDRFSDGDEVIRLIKLLKDFDNRCHRQYFRILEKHKDILNEEIDKLVKAQEDNNKRAESIAVISKNMALIEKIREKLQKQKDEIAFF